MAVPEGIKRLAGEWVGMNRVWLMPGAAARESETGAVVEVVGQGGFVMVRYTWSDEGVEQDGVLLMGFDAMQAASQAVWVDSWHMQDQMMTCQGLPGAEAATVQGSYAAPEGPDWGWRIAIVPDEGDAFRLVTHNITPDGEAYLAVEARYQRAGTG